MEQRTEVRALKGIGEKTAALFARLDIISIRDLIEHYPIGYDMFEDVLSVSEIRAGELCAVQGCLSGGISGKKAGRLTISACRIADQTGEVSLTFFNMPYLKKMIRPGEPYIFRGVVQGKEGKWKMEQPTVYKPEAYQALLNALQPRYSLTTGLTNHAITKAMRQAFSVCADLEEYLPDNIRERYQLTGYREALEGIHFPASEEMLQNARRRLVFDEFFLFMIRLRKCGVHSKSLSSAGDSGHGTTRAEAAVCTDRGAAAGLAGSQGRPRRTFGDEPPDSGGCGKRQDSDCRACPSDGCGKRLSGSDDGSH